MDWFLMLHDLRTQGPVSTRTACSALKPADCDRPVVRTASTPRRVASTGYKLLLEDQVLRSEPLFSSLYWCTIKRGYARTERHIRLRVHETCACRVVLSHFFTSCTLPSLDLAGLLPLRPLTWLISSDVAFRSQHGNFVRGLNTCLMGPRPGSPVGHTGLHP